MAEDNPISPTGPTGTVDRTALTPPSKRLNDLQEAIMGALWSFQKATTELLIQIVAWLLICLAFSTLTAGLYIYYLLNISFPYHWSWQIAYFTAIRITLIAAVFFIGIYCFKMLSASFQMYQHNRHKVAVLKSLPSLIVASHHQMKDGDAVSVEQNSIYNKILDIIISFSNTGILGNENELKPGTDHMNRILGILEKYLIKKAP